MSGTNNPIELLIGIKADTQGSKTGIQNSLNELSESLKGLEVGVLFDKDSMDSLKELANTNLDNVVKEIEKVREASEKLGNMEKVDLPLDIDLDVDGSKGKIQSQVDELSGKLKGLSVDIDVDKGSLEALKKLSNTDFEKFARGAERVGQSTQVLGKASTEEIENAWQSLSDSMKLDFGDAVGSMGADAQKLKKVLEGMNATVTVDESIKDGERDIRSLSATIEKDGVRNVIRFNKVLSDVGNNTQAFRWIPESVREVDSTLKTVYTSTQKFSEQLNKLYRDGKITEDQFRKLTQEVSKLGTPQGTERLESSLTNLNRKTDEYLRTNKRVAEERKAAEKAAEKAAVEQERNIQKLIKLENDLIAARRKHPTTIGEDARSDTMEADIRKLSQSSQIATSEVTKLENGLRRMKAEATEAGRSSMTIAESFKIAMEKFPVWMAASTAFYGTVRSIRDVFQQIVELDSQMTVLKRVAGDGADVNKVLAQSVELAGKLGNEIADINEGFIAFARQGFEGDDLARMAEYATLLGNISDLGVEEASSVLTAGMKGFNIEAENAIRIVDSLNEVDNNYSITTQQLAEAMQRSAGAASTYGKHNAA